MTSLYKRENFWICRKITRLVFCVQFLNLSSNDQFIFGFCEMAWTTVLTIIGSLIVVIYLWIKKRYSFFKEKGFPYKKPIFPFGNIKGVGQEFNATELFQKLYDELKGQGPACGVYFFITPNIMITDLDVIKDILIKNFDIFHNRGTYFNERDDPLSTGLFNLEDQAWKKMRVKLTPTFTSGKMKIMFDTVVDIASNMLKDFKEDEDIEIKDTLNNYTIDIIGNVAFGLEMHAISDPNSKFREMGKKVFKPDGKFFLKAFFLTSFKKLGRMLRMKFFPADVTEFFMGNIRETVEYRIKNKIERNDFMNLVLKMYTNGEKEEDKITMNELAAQCFLFFVAGSETSATTGAFAFYCLALNQDIQNTLRDEIQSTIKKYDNQITYEGVNEMKYLQMVVDGK